MMTIDTLPPRHFATQPLRTETGLPALLLDQYSGELPEKVDAIAIAVLVRDYEIARKLAHRLRGSAGMYGFPAVSEVAGFLEDACKIDPRSPVVTELVEELVSLVGEIAATSGA